MTMNNKQESMLSERGRRSKSWSMDPMRKARLEAYHNMYHPERNPKGILNLGIAENNLCEGLLMEKLNQKHMKEIQPELMYYSEFQGTERFRNILAGFLNERLHAKHKLAAENIIATSGVAGAVDHLAHVLFDPDDYFLQPVPQYMSTTLFMGIRSFVQQWDIQLSPTGGATPYELSVKRLEEEYQAATSAGCRVRGLVLINPHNPLGYVYSPELLLEILDWAKSHQLHVIFDEVYSLSLIDDDVNFKSVVALERIPDPQRTHLVWSISKTFSLAGFRVGVICSWNSAVIETIIPLCTLSAVPVRMQHTIACLLSDKAWLDGVFFPTMHDRMMAARDYCCGRLDQLGVPYLRPQAAFFIWADFNKFLSASTTEGELCLFNRLMGQGILISSSSSFYSTHHGWFRILFTQPQTIIDEGFKRIERAIKE